MITILRFYMGLQGTSKNTMVLLYVPYESLSLSLFFSNDFSQKRFSFKIAHLFKL